MGTPVKLYVYDLSLGISKILSASIIGRQIEGIWHTSIVVYEKEYFFGSDGIKSCTVGGTILQEPQEVVPLGETFVPYTLFFEYLEGLKDSSFTGASYNLLNHNCNHFSDEVAQFLCGVRIPKHILDLPDIIRETELGSTILELISTLGRGPNITDRRNREDSPDFLQLNSAIDEVRNLPPTDYSYAMAESEAASQNGESVSEEISDVSEVTKKARDVVAEIEAEERRELEELRNKQKDPPITFNDAVDVKENFEALSSLVEGKLNEEDQQSLKELNQYMLLDEGSWALGDGFLNFVGKLLNEHPPEVRTRLLNVMGAAALKDDVILLLHQDRKDHILMNYAGDVEKLTLEEQQSLALFIANLFENLSSSEWLLYISEWEHNTSCLSNIRVTAKVGINALLSENPILQDRGSAIVHNMACKEVFDDVAIELTMALLQFLNSKPSEELLFRAMKSLARFVQISGQEVTQLIQMIGPEPSKFKGSSSRIDQEIEIITSKLH